MTAIITSYVVSACAFAGLLFGGLVARVICGIICAYYLGCAILLEKKDPKIRQAIEDAMETAVDNALK